MINDTAICARYDAIKDRLDERGRRLFVAAEKVAAGYGGTAAVSRATGVAGGTIIRGAKDLLTGLAVREWVRRKGAGRPALSRSNRTVLEYLRRPVEPATMGIRCSPCCGYLKSGETASAQHTLDHVVNANTVGKMLETLGYSRQVNRKTKEGSRRPDRDAQFQHINRQVIALQAAGQPVISVDTKKKEPIGDYKNGCSDYRAAGCRDAVNVHDFVDKTLGKMAPYGIYVVATNTSWVSLGIDHDTAEVAVNAVCRWHQVVGSVRYATADHVLITADGGGSIGSRVRLRKLQLQTLADDRVELPNLPLSAGNLEVETRSSTGCSAISCRTG